MATPKEWRVVAEGGCHDGNSYPIPDKQPGTIGRSDSNDIVIPGAHLSRRHAQLHRLGDQVRVQDLNSISGTYVNDVQIGCTQARNGDRLRLDVYTFRIVTPEPTLQPAPFERVKPFRDATRRWKTRPTSPGNREELSPGTRSEAWLLAVLVVAAILLVGGLYWP